MKPIKDINGDIMKAVDGCSVQPFHAYVSLMLAVLKEPFVSSDAKYLMIQSSYSYLKIWVIQMKILKPIMKRLERL